MSLVILVDDNRTFKDAREHVRCRTSTEALAALPLLRRHPGCELWLDHDLGAVDDHLDTTLPVLDELARAAADDDPYLLGRVVVHTANPSGARTLLTVLRRWEYPATQLPACLYLTEETQNITPVRHEP